MSISAAFILALQLFVFVAVAGFIGTFLGRLLVGWLRHHSRDQCRASDLDGSEHLIHQAQSALLQARDIRIAAQALEQHLKGAAHV